MVSTFLSAQVVSPGLTPVDPPTGYFSIDGNLTANTPANTGDWLPGGAGAGGSVLTATGTVPVGSTTTFRRIDTYGSRDNIFIGGLKKDGNLWDYEWKIGGPKPPKCDINNLFVHIGDANNNDTWITLAGDRKEVNGNSFISIALLQKTVTADADFGFTTAAPQATGGRTVGDVQISAEFIDGGTNPKLYLEEWRLDAGAYKWVSFDISPIPAYGSTNGALISGLPFDVFGGSSYQANAFIEVSFNISEIYRNTATACVGSISSMLVMTKSSQAVNADLADFVDPIQINLDINVGKPTAPGANYCVGQTIQNLTASGETGAIFKWYTALDGDGKPTGTPTTGATYTPNIDKNIAGVYNVYVTQTLKGCESQPTTVTVTINPNPTAQAGTAPAAQCYLPAGNTFSLSGSGTYGSPSWAVKSGGNPGNLTVDITGGNTFTPSVKLSGNAAGGTVTLELTVTSGFTPSCGNATSEVAITVHPNATAGAGTTPTAQCFDPNGNDFVLSGSGSNGTPLWTVHSSSAGLNAVINGDNTYTPSVEVTGGSGTVTLRLTVTSQTTPSCGVPYSDVTVTVNPLPTADAGTAPAAQCYVAAGNTFNLNGSGVNGTPSWAVKSGGNPGNLTVDITGGNTLSPSVKLSGNAAGGTVTLVLTVTSTSAPSCGTPTSEVAITVHPNATANAGTPPTAQCFDPNGNDFALSGSGSNGTPLWTVHSSSAGLSADISGADTYTPSVEVTGGSDTVTLRLTVTSQAVPACGAPTSEVTVTVNPLPTADAGTDPAVQCYVANGNHFNLAGTGVNGTPSWAIAPGGNPANLMVDITNGNTLQPSVKISGNTTGGTVILQLTVTSNTSPACGNKTDDINLTVSPQVGGPSANMLPVVCTDPTFSIQVESPVEDTKYTVTQPLNNNPYSEEFTFDGTNGPVVFNGLKFGDGFRVIASKNGCTSAEENCPDNSQLVAKRPAPAQTVTARISATNQPKVLAFPNPYSDKIRFNLETNISGYGALDLYNMLGQKVKSVFQGYVEKGQQRTVDFNVPYSLRKNMVYIFSIGDQRTTGKLINLSR